MTVPTPGAFGLILRKNSRTRPFISTLPRFLEDEHLVGVSVAMHEDDLLARMKALETAGCVRGVDFVPTDSLDGVLDELPAWLEMSLAPTGNPPELEATMTPEVCALWQSYRRKLYTFVPDGLT